MQSVYMCMNVGVDVLVSPSNGMLVRNLSKQKRKETTQKTTNGFQCKCVCLFVCAGLSVCVCVFMYCVYLYVCMYVYTYICVKGCLSQSAIANKSEDDCCSVLQSGTACLQCGATCCSADRQQVRRCVLQCVAVWNSVLQCVAACCSVLQCVAVHCSALQYVIVH